MRVLILGRPGAGKGTQSRVVASHFKVPRVSSGDLFRVASRRDSRELGPYAASAQLVADNVVLEVLRPHLSDLASRTGFVLEGFPHRVSQVFLLDEILGDRAIDVAVYIEVSVSVVTARLLERTSCLECAATYSRAEVEEGRRCPGCMTRVIRRPDDEEAKIAQRIEEFEKHTVPVVELYAARGLLRSIDGHGSIDVVSGRIIQTCAEKSKGD